MNKLDFMELSPGALQQAGCYAAIDPHYASHGTPARMADGRVMTDYRPRCYQYPTVAAAEFGDNDVRMRMTHGAEILMEQARELNNRKVTSQTCVDTMVPELYKRVCTWKGCKTVPGNFQGIGTGRIYVPSIYKSASAPQALSDATIPTAPGTFPRRPPPASSQCARDDPETAFALKGSVAIYGSSAASHPYSAPRS
jgi:hypothetical protein